MLRLLLWHEVLGLHLIPYCSVDGNGLSRPQVLHARCTLLWQALYLA
jgi:hypothetical protein